MLHVSELNPKAKKINIELTKIMPLTYSKPEIKMPKSTCYVLSKSDPFFSLDGIFPGSITTITEKSYTLLILIHKNNGEFMATHYLRHHVNFGNYKFLRNSWGKKENGSICDIYITHI